MRAPDLALVLALLPALAASTAGCSKSPEQLAEQFRINHLSKIEAVLARARVAEDAVRALPACAQLSLASTPKLNFQSYGNATHFVLGQVAGEAVPHDLAISPTFHRAAALLAKLPSEEFADREMIRLLEEYFTDVERLRYVLVVRVYTYPPLQPRNKLGFSTFEPGVITGDATVVELETAKIVGCLPWTAPDRLMKYDPGDDVKWLRDRWSRCAIHRALDGAGVASSFARGCKDT